MNEQPTDRDVLVVAGLVDDLLANASIEDAFRSEPLTRQEQINEVLMRQIREHGDPQAIAAADILMAQYKTGGFRTGDA